MLQKSKVEKYKMEYTQQQKHLKIVDVEKFSVWLISSI